MTCSTRTGEFAAGRQVAVRSLHVQLHVALLGEADGAHLTPVGLLSRVFDPVHLQSALLVEGFITQRTLEGPLT